MRSYAETSNSTEAVSSMPLSAANKPIGGPRPSAGRQDIPEASVSKWFDSKPSANLSTQLTTYFRSVITSSTAHATAC